MPVVIVTCDDLDSGCRHRLQRRLGPSFIPASLAAAILAVDLVWSSMLTREIRARRPRTQASRLVMATCSTRCPSRSALASQTSCIRSTIQRNSCNTQRSVRSSGERRARSSMMTSARPPRARKARCELQSLPGMREQPLRSRSMHACGRSRRRPPAPSALRSPAVLAPHRTSRSTQSARFRALSFRGCIRFCQLL